MAELFKIVEYCDRVMRRGEIEDFEGAYNGLQVENSGKVRKIGAAVDAGLVPFERAVELGINFLIVHHGLFWSPIMPLSGVNYRKLKILFDGDMAVYSAHLPLDGHREIGNNALIAKGLGLKQVEWFLEYKGTMVGLIAEGLESRDALRGALKRLFPNVVAMEFGSRAPERVAISSGSGNMVVSELRKAGVDTLVTGELREHHFNMAQELGLNLYVCGHYATEIFGVKVLAEKVAREFDLPWEFVGTECPL